MQVGDMFPDFTLPRDGGTMVSRDDFKGRKLVVYLYPKDNTPGCTTEALEFSAALPEFRAAGAEVVGVSKDSVRKHDNFVAKHGLTIPLLSDEDGTLIEALGAWVEKKNYGRTYMGIERSTFLVDETGIIRRIWRKVRVKGHVAEVLEAVKAL